MQPVPMAREDPGSGWLFEPLFDGRRCLAVLDGGELELFENGTRRVAARYPDLEAALVAAASDRFAVDGEILAVDPDFEQGLILPKEDRIIDDGRRRELEYRFLAFDLLWAAGLDLRAMPLLERRNALRALFRYSPTVMYVRESTAPGEIVFSRAENERWLGVVAKRGESPYVSGPSPDWRVWRRRPAR
jgi:bifunctional non-homologous end joining protein LigD